MVMRFVLEYWLVVAVMLSMCTGCHQDKTRSSPLGKPWYTEADLDELLRTNMSRQEVFRLLGRPLTGRGDVTTDGTLIYHFLLLEELPRNAPNLFVSGVTVRFQNDKVINWSPVYHGTIANKGYSPSTRVQPATNGMAPHISFWIVSEEAVPAGRYIDTPELPKLGYIGSRPDLTITELKSATWAKELAPVTPSPSGELAIELTDRDSGALKRLTETNVLRRLLLMVDDKPITAPVILMPIGGGVLAIECKGEQCDRLKEAIARLVRG